MEIHKDVRVDDYYWLNEKENPEVIQYLNDENTYFNDLTKGTAELQEELFQEMKSRLKEDDASVPVKKNGYFYYSRYEEGGQYPIHCRKKGSLENEEEIVFNVNEMAKDFSYYSLSSYQFSPNNRFVAYSVDTVSRRKYTIHIKDIETGELFSEKIENTSGPVVWANDNKTFFYTHKDPDDLRESKIRKHTLDSSAKEDIEIYYEADDIFNCYVSKSKSGKYIFINSYSTLTTENQYLNADTPHEDFTIFQKRTKGLEYHVKHSLGQFIILTNKDKASNYKIMTCSDDSTSKENWQTFIDHNKDTFIDDFIGTKNFIAIEERSNGLKKIRIVDLNKSTDFYINFDEETYDVSLSGNASFETETIRYNYNSFTTPNSVIDFDIKTKAKTIKKEQEVLGGKFKKENYLSKRVWATARDGKKVPISMVYHKDTVISKDTPFLLYAYGSYGITIPDYFSSVRLSLLDRGFVYATTHIRGSQYLGKEWYEDGKFFKKMNTFTDFIDSAKYLIENKYTSPEHLYAQGGSAGGLLMGAIVNLDSKLFNGVHAAVPFVDVMTTMLDDTLPLTTGEYEEWGNPNEKEAYEYMLSYSPYDNVTKKDYPNMLVTTGLHDSQVQYFEPAKWVAKLRDFKTDNNLLLLQTDMEVGHGGASGRFDGLKDKARDYSFFIGLELDLL
ncbi:MAG: oligopeptidase B [Planctomycetota bacterium]|jgi:oligopeptidase B